MRKRKRKFVELVGVLGESDHRCSLYSPITFSPVARFRKAHSLKLLCSASRALGFLRPPVDLVALKFYSSGAVALAGRGLQARLPPTSAQPESSTACGRRSTAGGLPRSGGTRLVLTFRVEQPLTRGRISSRSGHVSRARRRWRNTRCHGRAKDDASASRPATTHVAPAESKPC